METIFIHLGIILFIAFMSSYVVRIFKQPLIIGYIFSGVVIALIIEKGIIEIGATSEIIQGFSQLGIAFLLFIVGLHMNPKIIKDIGIASIIIGGGQIVLTFLIGFLFSNLLFGYDYITSAYLGIALSFSSTIIIMKLLSDKKKLDSLYGKISVGILIIQDLVAVGVLMVISSFSDGTNLTSFAIKSLLGGGGLIAILFFTGYFVLPWFTKQIAKSQELLFLFSICWCFIIAALFSLIGFSMEIGALMAGIVLSLTPYATEISSKIRPLRDFFLIIFFIILGLNVDISSIGSVLTNAIILSIITLIFKPLIIMVIMRQLGYTKRTNFLTGITLAQISEFSLIVLSLGVTMGHISNEILSTITLTGIITIAISTYLIMYSQKIYEKIQSKLLIFEKKNIKREQKIKNKYDAILFGYNRIGFGILNSLKQIKKNYLVVDYNPDTISALTKLGIPSLYGDSDDLELLQELPLEDIKLAVSTIPDFETNILLIEAIRKVNKDAIIIVRAHQIQEALELYREGASYVLTPHFLGGEYVAKMIRELKICPEDYHLEKQKHIENLTKIMLQGKEHPSVEKN